MIDPIRLATEEEIKKIATNSDLVPGCSVWAMGQILGVVRPCIELDPVWYHDAPDREKMLFVWGMENMLRAMGTTQYYFNVPNTDEYAKYRSIVERMGASTTSQVPELRYKKVL